MKNVYINGVGAVTVQGVYDENFFEEETVPLKNVNYAQHPSYKNWITPAMIRRMSTAVKMGIYASQTALDDAQLTTPETIITGTGMGCLQDSEKFLRSLIENQEQFLTPTSFIQSTHNTVGAQIALRLQCKGYNFTYVNGANSFENALLDAKLQIQNSETQNVLLGGIDEISDYTLSLLEKIQHIKKEGESIDFKNPQTNGVPFGEGAAFFVLSDEKTAETYAEIKDVSVFITPNKQDIKTEINDFLHQNQLELEDIDAIILGKNGDMAFDAVYKEVAEMFHKTPQIYYKHLSGEYNTASAIGFLAASHLIKKQTIPVMLQLNPIQPVEIKKVLLFNQYRATDFSFVLLSQ